MSFVRFNISTTGSVFDDALILGSPWVIDHSLSRLWLQNTLTAKPEEKLTFSQHDTTVSHVQAGKYEIVRLFCSF